MLCSERFLVLGSPSKKDFSYALRHRDSRLHELVWYLHVGIEHLHTQAAGVGGRSGFGHVRSARTAVGGARWETGSGGRWRFQSRNVNARKGQTASSIACLFDLHRRLVSFEDCRCRQCCQYLTPCDSKGLGNHGRPFTSALLPPAVDRLQSRL